MSGSPSLRTPLARVRNLGSSHSGTKDFWRQRLTAVAMTLLIVPVIVIVLMLLRSNHAGAICPGVAPRRSAIGRAANRAGRDGPYRADSTE